MNIETVLERQSNHYTIISKHQKGNKQKTKQNQQKLKKKKKWKKKKETKKKLKRQQQKIKRWFIGFADAVVRCVQVFTNSVSTTQCEFQVDVHIWSDSFSWIFDAWKQGNQIYGPLLSRWRQNPKEKCLTWIMQNQYHHIVDLALFSNLTYHKRGSFSIIFDFME